MYKSATATSLAALAFPICSINDFLSFVYGKKTRWNRKDSNNLKAFSGESKKDKKKLFRFVITKYL